MTDREYYRNQLKNLNLNKDDYVNMKLSSDNGETKYLGLNKDSLFEMIDFSVRNGIVSLEDVEKYLGADEYIRKQRTK